MNFRKTAASFFLLAILLAGNSCAWAQEKDERPRDPEHARERVRGKRPYLPAQDDPKFKQAMQERQECKRDCMSREDRRKLRRDINDAGRELYRPPPREH